MGCRRNPARAACLLAAVAGSASPASAEDGVPCPDRLDLGAPVSLGQVTAGGRVPFLKAAADNPACPSLAPACRDKAYLVAGNRVLRGASRGEFVCATYVGAKGATRSGWMQASALASLDPAATSLDDWTGTWTSGPEQTITIARKGGGLALSGDASYGTQDPDRVKRGAVNMGSFAVEGRPDGPRLAFTDTEDKAIAGLYRPDDVAHCSVRMRLLPPYLITESNTACGGMNVSFTGIYRRGG